MISKAKILAKLSAITVLAVMSGIMLSGSLVNADSVAAKTTSDTTTTPASSATTGSATVNQQHLQTMISRGNQEIERRLTTLSGLTTKINSATHLSASDQQTLSQEVSSTISGLNTLKSQLDGASTVASARTYVSDIFSEYRVYALVAPKVNLVKVADDQQVVEIQLISMESILQTRINMAKQQGKDVSALQSELNSMVGLTSSSQAVSSSIEGKVIGLQPSDYNSNHQVLEGDNTELQTAHKDNAAAYADAKTIVSGLKSL